MSTKDLEASMRKSVEATQRNFNTIRTGRANSSLLDRISVEYYGAETPLKSLATLSTPDLANGNNYNGTAQALQLGTNSFTVNSVGFDRLSI